SGATVGAAPRLSAEPLEAVGEDLNDWLTLTRLDPAYRAFFPDGSTLDMITDPERMADEITRVCGAREADGYRGFIAFATELWRLERDDFIARNLDGPWDLLRPGLFRLIRMGAFRSLGAKVGDYFRDPRTQRIFSFQSLYAGLAP